jgi:competence protein ComFC
MKNFIIKTLKDIPEKLLEFLLPKSEKTKKIEGLRSDILLDKLEKRIKMDIKDSKVLFSYKDILVKDIIWFFKYNHNKKMITVLAEISAETLFEWVEDLKTFENFTSPILIPIPMSKTKKILRRGNHIEILCEKIIELIPKETLSYDNKSLIKFFETKSQAKTSNRKERLKNISGSFKVDPKNVKGKNLILIDDVITTGATVLECKKILLEAGAKRVIIFALAH